MDQKEHIASLGPDFLEFFENWMSLPKTNYVPDIKSYLENAVPKLQPDVVIMEQHSPSETTIRFAGANTNVDQVYVPSVKSHALELVWAASNHPCGYFVERVFETEAGLQGVGITLLLPIHTTSDAKSIVLYNGTHTFGDEKLDDVSGQTTIVDYRNIEWIDIGAGIPE